MKKRVRTPTIIQMEPIESGAAALGIILGYYGRFVPLEQLRLSCGISRDGSLAINMIAAARLYGLEVEEFKLPFEEIKNVQYPFIISWHHSHYVVVEGIKGKTIYINDPATGPRKIGWDEMQANFTGLILSFLPSPDFKKQGHQNPPFKTLINRLKGCNSALFYLFLTGVFLLIPGIALPTFTQFFVDEILVRHLTGTAGIFIIGMLISLVLAGLLTGLQGYFLARLSSKLSIRLSSHFLWHILKLPIEFYTERFGGEIAYRLTINDRVITTITAELASAFISLLLVIAYGILMFFYDPIIAMIGICAGLINLLVLVGINRMRTDANIRLQQDMGKRVGVSIGGLQNIETIKAVAAESDYFSRWHGYFTKTINTTQAIGKLDILLTVIPPFTQFAAAAAVLTLGGMRVMEGKMTLGMLLGLQTLMQTFLLPISNFIYLAQNIQNVKGDLFRLDDVLSNPTDPMLQIYHEDKPEEAKLKGGLELKNVTFGYNKLSPPLLENFQLTIKPGQSVALVGPSGCGKTTVARLITGLYQPWSGSILQDEKPVSELSRSIINRSLGSVDQQIFLFEGTIRDNLTLWDKTLPEEDVVNGAIDAAIHSDILERENGYDSSVLEGGINFSGGQRQRLEIARVFALNPTFLILDEATSALDSETEEYIIKKIRQRGCSCLVIAHRLSTIRDCDEIIVLDKGKVVNRGSHEALKQESELYKELIRLEGALEHK